ncbi:hypothetical protein Vadar_012379 [Vaccinium darrowii]|uniref:Uncharacterized protein n=1 Tax=Vaccinium darrowii TaxID=229202 RepID=A0ACB7XYG7_9ERIC|nr:hypothetical protein Vadar_012379 [Vaccinium darrowii]
MNSQILPRFSLLSIPTLFLFLQFPFSLANPDPDEVFYSSCGATFNCGSIAGVGYPFRGYQEPEFCGYPGLVLTCGNNNITTLVINDIIFRVLDINPSAQTMNIAREDVMEATCPQELVNTTLDNSLFEYSSSYINLTFLYGCPAPITLIPGIDQIGTCNVSGYSGVYLMPGTIGWVGCDVSVTVPVSNLAGSINSTDLGEAVETGFGVKWKVDTSVCSGCTGSGGHCGYSNFSKQTTCYCPNPPYVSGTCLTTVGARAGAPSPSPSKITPGTNGKALTSIIQINLGDNVDYQVGQLKATKAIDSPGICDLSIKQQLLHWKRQRGVRPCFIRSKTEEG